MPAIITNKFRINNPLKPSIKLAPFTTAKIQQKNIQDEIKKFLFISSKKLHSDIALFSGEKLVA